MALTDFQISAGHKLGAGRRQQKYDPTTGKYTASASVTRTTHDPMTASAGVTIPADLEMAWVVYTDDGLTVAVEELACHSKACAPPSAGGSGGSLPGGGTTAAGFKRMSDDELELLFPGRRGAGNKVVNDDGTMSVEGLDSKGRPTKFSAGVEKALDDEWDAIGHDREAYVQNFVIGGKLAMGINPKTGAVDAAVAANGTFNSKWYTVAHDDVQKIADHTGIPVANVTAATTVMSAGRLWSGVKNGNIESADRLAKMMKNNQEFEVEQRHLDMMAWRAEKSTKGVGRLGLNGDGALKPGKVKLSDLDSATAVEVMYAMNAMRGQKSFDDWRVASKDGKRTPSVKEDPPFPLFTSKGTQQVKQALSVLRGEVTPREAISGPKYSSFYSNIRNPNADYSSTNDTWHYRIMAGNLPLTHTRKGETRTDTIDRLSMDERAPKPDGATKGQKFATSQDIFQAGPASKKDGITAGDGMFRDTTVMTRKALDQLKIEYPAQFGNMKIHEFQALIWVHYGGGSSSKTDRLAAWDGAREAMKEVGS